MTRVYRGTHMVNTKKARVCTMSKRKATYDLSKRQPFKKTTTTTILSPSQRGEISANRALAVMRRQAQLQAMPLQRASPQEKGFVDYQDNTTFNTTGDIQLIATIAQGASVNQRIGKKAMLRSVQIRGYAYAGATAIYNDCAMLIVYDRRPTGALPAVTDILVAADATALNNDSNSGRFQILRRRDFSLIGNSTTPTTGQEMISMDDFITVNRKIIFKAAGTGAIGDLEEGALYHVCVGINAAGGTAASGSFNFRTRFTEM